MQKLLTTILFCASAFVQAQDAKEILLKAAEKCETIEKGYYEMEEYSSNNRNNKLNEYKSVHKSHFLNVKNDSLFGVHFSTKTFRNDTFYSIGTNNQLSFAKYYAHLDSGIWVDKSKTHLRQYAKTHHFFPRYSQFVGDKPLPIVSFGWVNNSKQNYSLLGLEVLNSTDTCYVVRQTRKPNKNENQESVEFTYWVKTDNYLPIKFERRILTVDKWDSITHVFMRRIYNFKLNDGYTLNKEVFNASSKPWFSMLAPYKEREPDGLKIGTVAPDWTLENIEGDSIKLSDLKGNVVMLDFFIGEFGPCNNYKETLENLHKKYGKKGFVLIGLSYFSTKEELAKYSNKYNLSYYIISSNKEISNMYNVSGYPSVYIINKKGMIDYYALGCGVTLPKEYKKAIKKALKE